MMWRDYMFVCPYVSSAKVLNEFRITRATPFASLRMPGGIPPFPDNIKLNWVQRLHYHTKHLICYFQLFFELLSNAVPPSKYPSTHYLWPVCHVFLIRFITYPVNMASINKLANKAKFLSTLQAWLFLLSFNEAFKSLVFSEFNLPPSKFNRPFTKVKGYFFVKKSEL